MRSGTSLSQIWWCARNAERGASCWLPAWKDTWHVSFRWGLVVCRRGLSLAIPNIVCTGSLNFNCSCRTRLKYSGLKKLHDFKHDFKHTMWAETNDHIIHIPLRNNNNNNGPFFVVSYRRSSTKEAIMHEYNTCCPDSWPAHCGLLRPKAFLDFH